MSRLAASPYPRLTLCAIGDSQTDALGFSYCRPDQKWPSVLAGMLAAQYGLPIKARNFGISGQTTAQLLSRCDIMQRWEVPDLAAIHVGVNDVAIEATPGVSASATGGTISSSGGYAGVVFVATDNIGQRWLLGPVAVQVPSGSTGSIAIASVTTDLPTAVNGVVQIDIYTTQQLYATAAAALAVSTQSYLFCATPTITSAVMAAYTITALPSGTTKCPSVSMQSNLQALIKALKYGVAGIQAGIGLGTDALTGVWVAGQSNLPANAPPTTRILVMDDTSATGGMAALANTQQHATIAGNYSGANAAQQTVWERRTPQAGEAGWGRVAVTGTAPFSGCCSRILVVSANYLNWASGANGDNIDVATGYAFAFGTSSDSASAGTYYSAYSYQSVRTAQAAAVSAENAADTSCLFVDLFAFQSGLIAAGETTQGSNAWHWAPNNQHHNAYGHDIVARACLSAMAASRPAWLTALAAL